MPITNEQYNRMCAYFDGEMSLDEEKAFLEEIEKDPELKKEFEWEEKIIFNSVPEEIEQPLVASDNGIRDIVLPVENKVVTIPLPQQGRRIDRTIFVTACALTLLLLLFNAILHISAGESNDPIPDPDQLSVWNDSVKANPQLPPDQKDQQLANQELQEKRRRANSLGRHQPDLVFESPLLGEVQVAFADANYAGVEQKADHISPTRGNEPEKENIKIYAVFYKGIANIELNKDSIALIQLSEVTRKSASFPALAKEAKWNMAKAYYKLGRTGEAKSILQKLSGDNAFPFKKDAASLLELVNK